jgi:hypothetical protein
VTSQVTKLRRRFPFERRRVSQSGTGFAVHVNHLMATSMPAARRCRESRHVDKSFTKLNELHCISSFSCLVLRLQLGDRANHDLSMINFTNLNEPHYPTFISYDFGAQFKARGLVPGLKVMQSVTKALSATKPAAGRN